jgi:HAD superfamily hydrolase (TIGR01549 family)
MIRAVIFDVDGTLVTFTFDIAGTRRALIGELISRGYSTSDLTTTTLTQVILDSAKEQIESGRVNDDYQALRSRVFSMLDRFELDSAKEAKPILGTLNTLKGLRLSSIRLGALTNSGRAGATRVLKKGGLMNVFELILTRDDVPAMKPKPDGILKALDLLNLSKDELLTVGDSVIDIQAADAAGVRVASVATGNYSRERLVSEGADLIMSSISELPALLRTLS